MNHLSKARMVFFIIGILTLALGIALTIVAELGTSPFDALLVGLSTSVGLTVGSWEIIIAFILILSNALLTRKSPEFLGLVTAFITGIGIDVWLFLLGRFVEVTTVIHSFVLFGIGLLLMGVGTAIYLQTNFSPIPIDRFMLILRELTNMSIFMARTMINLAFLLLAFLFQGPIGIGTVLTVCFSGLILNFFMPYTEKFLSFTSSLPEAKTQTDTSLTQKANN